MKTIKFYARLSVAVMLASQSTAIGQTPMGTAFVYQGRLTDGGNPANGAYDFAFTLYDAATAGSQIGSPVAIEDQPVTNGLFTVQLDFGSGIFTGDARWLEIGVRPWDSTGTYTYLDPLQELTPAPYALYAANAPTAAHDHNDLYYAKSHIDALEARIAALESLLAQPEVCDDSFDNDFDGQQDCDDADCLSDAACGGTETDCTNALDEDNDGMIDCQDTDCDGLAGPGGGTCTTGAETICDDSYDNDADGTIDCLDDDCDGISGGGGICNYGTETICNDYYDNDTDSQIDCNDSDCLGQQCFTSRYLCQEDSLGHNDCYCEVGYGDCDGNDANGCETVLDDNAGTCLTATNLGYFCADEGGHVDTSGIGEGWFRVEARECDFGEPLFPEDLYIHFVLQPAPEVIQEIYVYDSCSHLISPSGGTDDFDITIPDTFGDQSRTYWIEVRYEDAEPDSSPCNGWQLNIHNY